MNFTRALKKLDAWVYGDTIKVPMSFTRVSIQKINDTCGIDARNFASGIYMLHLEGRTFVFIKE